MPVKVSKQGDKYRVVKASTGRIEKTSTGKARDGGGHKNKSTAERQARAINSKS